MNLWSDLSAFVLGGGVAAYFVKYIFDRYLAIEMERHKNSLSLQFERFRHDFTLEVEKFKEKLNEAAHEHKIKFAQLHEERAGIIKELYHRLLSLSDDLRDQTIALNRNGASNGNNGESRLDGNGNGNGNGNGVLMIDIVTNELVDFYNYFLQKKIYFSNELSLLIEQLFEKYLGQIQYTLNLRSYMKNCSLDSTLQKCDLERISIDINQTVEIVSRLEERIVQEFQQMLGVQ